MHLLICGGAGYIGSHMCKLLAEHGHEVSVVDDLSTGHAEAVRWGELHSGNLGDADFLREVFRQAKPEGVFHFAAKSLVEESMRRPDLYYRNNVSATLNLLEVIRETVQCPFIFSSTAAIFGIPGAALIAEDHPAAPINPYGRTKLQVEQMLQDYWAAYKLPSVSFRYFNAAGADGSGLIGEAHQPETHLIPRVLESMLGRGGAIALNGDDYDTPDGTCIRDYIHVNDLCEAHLLGLEKVLREPGLYQYNLGNGTGFSVKEVFSAVERVIQRPVQYQVAGRRPGDPPRLVADSRKASEELRWQPKHRSLDEIILSAWRWHSQRLF